MKKNIAALVILVVLIAVVTRVAREFALESPHNVCSISGICLDMSQSEVRALLPNPRVSQALQKATENWNYSVGLGNYPSGFLDVTFRFGKVRRISGTREFRLPGHREPQHWKRFSEVASQLGPPAFLEGTSQVYHIDDCRLQFSTLDRGDGIGPLTLSYWDR